MSITKEKAKESLQILKELFEDELISKEDYEEKKKEVLALLSGELSRPNDATLKKGYIKKTFDQHLSEIFDSTGVTGAVSSQNTSNFTTISDKTISQTPNTKITSKSSSLIQSPILNESSINPSSKPLQFKKLDNVKTLSEHTNYIFSLVIGSGKLFSASHDTTIKVWDLRSLNCLKTIEAHSQPIYALILTETHL